MACRLCFCSGVTASLPVVVVVVVVLLFVVLAERAVARAEVYLLLTSPDKGGAG